MKWEGQWYIWERTTGWRLFADKEKNKEARDLQQQVLERQAAAKEAAVAAAKKSPPAAPVPVPIPKAVVTPEQEHAFEADAGLPTSAFAPGHFPKVMPVAPKPPPERVVRAGDVIPLFQKASPERKKAAYAAMERVLLEESPPKVKAMPAMPKEVAIPKEHAMATELSTLQQYAAQIAGMLQVAMGTPMGTPMGMSMGPRPYMPVPITMLRPPVPKMIMPSPPAPPRLIPVSGDTTDEEAGEEPTRDP